MRKNLLFAMLFITTFSIHAQGLTGTEKKDLVQIIVTVISFVLGLIINPKGKNNAKPPELQ